MNAYLLSFNEVFKPIIDYYGFEVKSDNETISLLRGGFKIEFIMWREAVEVNFCVIKSDNEMLKYNVRDFIVTYMTNEDRVIDDSAIPTDETAVHIRNVKSLFYFSNALKNHFPSMLEGKMDWLDAYKKSDWYSQPRIEKIKK
ncbi:hypothetical protein [Kosakonia oryzae]|uniref:hypothetical protein n=1 Tax=Kosakonia oryzae TaxID=497725 RepID=UPI001D068DAF|nr:hypothetical protein [Kosakonia oryzae]UDJ80724.1 hypothetical protein I5186_16180 [Kosakonia oryzae]